MKTLRQEVAQLIGMAASGLPQEHMNRCLDIRARNSPWCSLVYGGNASDIHMRVAQARQLSIVRLGIR